MVTPLGSAYFAAGPEAQGEQARLLALIQQLGEERIAPRAALYDREARHPVESWRDLWEHGLLGMMIPREYGGLGVDGLTFVRAMELLGRYCAATAMTLNMHQTIMSFIAFLGSAAQKRRLFRQVVERGCLFASWGSEPASSVNRAYHRDTVIRPIDGGFAIDGAKFFCTMAGAAEQAAVHCVMEGAEDSLSGAILALVHRDNPGFQIVGEWDTLGMRGTVSPSTVFKDCRVEPDALLGKPGEMLRCGAREQFFLGYAAVYLGIATSALQYTVDYCRTKTFKPDPNPIAHDRMIQHDIGELAAELDGARLTLLDAGRRWDSALAPEREVVSARAKYLCMQAGLKTTEACVRIIGGRAALKELPVERAYRDLRTCTLMPPNRDRMLEILGRHELRLDK